MNNYTQEHVTNFIKVDKHTLYNAGNSQNSNLDMFMA